MTRRLANTIALPRVSVFKVFAYVLGATMPNLSKHPNLLRTGI